MGRGKVSVGDAGFRMRRPGSKIEWSLDSNKVAAKRSLCAGTVTKEWSTDSHTGEVYASLNVDASLRVGGVRQVLEGQAVRFSSLADTTRIVGGASVVLGASVVDKEEPNLKYVAGLALSDQFSEMRLVNGGRALQATALHDRSIGAAFVGVEMKHGKDKETHAYMTVKNTVGGQATPELMLSHAPDNSRRIRFTINPSTGAYGVNCDFTI